MTAATLEPTAITTPLLCRLAGVTYRVLDYWVRTDVIRPVRRARGSGNSHQWAADQIQIVAALRVLAAMHAHGPQLRAAAVALEHRADLDAPGWLIVAAETPAAYVVDDDDLVDDLEAGEGAWVIRLPVALRGTP